MHWKKSLLVIHKILGRFVNTLAINDKHYLLNRDNLTQPFKIQLSQKQKIFPQFFFAFLKSIFNICQNKMTLIADVFREIPAAKNMGRKMSQKLCFRRPLDRQHGKWGQTLLISEWQHLYNIY